MLQSRPPGRHGTFVAALLLALVASLLAPVAARAQAPAGGQQLTGAQIAQEAFAVRDVEVDVTAASAAAARDQAIAEAQRKAFATLYRRMASAAPPNLSEAQLAGLVQGFEVQRERSSSVRYLATLTVRFRPSAVRAMLQERGVAFADPPSRPFLVLPVTRVGGRAVLWEDRTPWREAWENAVPGGFIPIQVPLGEVADLADVTAEEALTADRAKLEGIAGRYGAGDVLVTVADLPASGQPDTSASGSVAVRRLPAAGLPSETTVTVPAAPGRSAAEYMAGGVAAVLARMEEEWRRGSTPESREERRLRVAVPLGRLDDWVQTRQRLVATPGVSKVDLLALSRQRAEVEIAYLGDLDRLRSALGQRELTLSPDPAAATAPPPVPVDLQPAIPGAPGLPPEAAVVPAPAESWLLRWNGAAAR